MITDNNMMNNSLTNKNNNLLTKSVDSSNQIYAPFLTYTDIYKPKKNLKYYFKFGDFKKSKGKKWITPIKSIWSILVILFLVVAVPCLVIIPFNNWWDMHTISLLNNSFVTNDNSSYYVYEVQISGPKLSETDLHNLKFEIHYSYLQGFIFSSSKSGTYTITNSDIVSSNQNGKNYEYILKLSIPYNEYETLQEIYSNYYSVRLELYVTLWNSKPIVLNDLPFNY